MPLVLSSKCYLFFPVAFLGCEHESLLSSHALIGHQGAGNTEWPEQRQPWHFSGRALSLLDISCSSPPLPHLVASLAGQRSPLEHSKSCCFQKKFVSSKEKKKKWIITTVWKHKTSFSPNYLMAGVGFFVLFPLAEELFRNTWSEKQIVLGVPAQPWEDLIWFPAPNEAENRPERCVCDDLPLDHPAAEQTDGILPHKFLALHTKGFS